jgi:ribosomal protein S27E
VKYGEQQRMEDRIRFECVKCEGVGHVEHEHDHHFYTVTFCPFCGEELELEPDLDLTNIYEQEYEANN